MVNNRTVCGEERGLSTIGVSTYKHSPGTLNSCVPSVVTGKSFEVEDIKCH
jgi:hypothetical protein